MSQYKITGMSCAACAARIESAVAHIPEVEMCTVSLLTNSMTVTGSASADVICDAVKKVGYGATPASGDPIPKEKTSQNDEFHSLRRRLIFSVVDLLLLMYVSMGCMMWGFPLPPFFDGNSLAISLLELILTLPILVWNRAFFIRGLRAVIHFSPNMDTLVALGSGASFLYSLVIVFLMTGTSDSMTMMDYCDGLYFDSAAMILTLITVGKTLECYAKGKTTSALDSLNALRPTTATLIQHENEVTVPIDRVKIGDVFLVHPGDAIPVDGTVLTGVSAVDESALTGESIPVDKVAGDTVSAATINCSGSLTCCADAVGEDTFLSQIIARVSDAAATKAPIAKIADKIARVFVPAVLLIAIVTFIVWFLYDNVFAVAMTRSVAVLVISCPCALGLATPVAIMVGSGVGARHGILFKNAETLEQTGRIRQVALDKTGTITQGTPRVTDISPYENVSVEQLLSIAASLEQNSEHPLAKAVRDAASEKQILPYSVSDFHALLGNGVSAVIDGVVCLGGNYELVAARVSIPTLYQEKIQALQVTGKTPLYFCRDHTFLGTILVADGIRPEASAAIASMKRLGCHVVMVTGDNARTASAIATAAGIDTVYANVKPNEKEQIIIKMQERGRVCMVGDGINDAPALTRADVGIAIGAGTDVAIDAADIVLVKSRLTDVIAALDLSRHVLRNIYENLFWAFCYNIVGIPLAAGVWIPLFGWEISPMFGALAMSFSSVLVVTNALRLNLWRPKSIYQKAVKSPSCEEEATTIEYSSEESEVNVMKKTLFVEGMMCTHCEATVEKALEALPEVESAKANHKNGKVIVKCVDEIADEKLATVITNAGYTVK